MAVQLIRHGNGDYSLGAEIDGVFVPFVTHSKGRVAQLHERGANLQQRAKDGDAQAKSALGSPVQAKRPKGAKSEDESAGAVEPEEDES